MRFKLVALVAILTLLGFGWFFYQSSLDKSYAEVYLANNDLTFDLHISEKDQSNFKNFIKQLGGKDFKKASLELDDKTLSHLKNILPTKMNVYFYDKKISFTSSSFHRLNSTLAEDQYHLATASSDLLLTYKTDQDFALKVLEPANLLNYATSSGQLYLSSKLSGLFPILNKIAKIDLEVHGQSIFGDITLH